MTASFLRMLKNLSWFSLKSCLSFRIESNIFFKSYVKNLVKHRLVEGARITIENLDELMGFLNLNQGILRRTRIKKERTPTWCIWLLWQNGKLSHGLSIMTISSFYCFPYLSLPLPLFLPLPLSLPSSLRFLSYSLPKLNLFVISGGYESFITSTVSASSSKTNFRATLLYYPDLLSFLSVKTFSLL